MSESNPALEAAQQSSEKMFAAIRGNTCFRVEAGAGAGKTYSLIEALNDLCEKKAPELERNGQKIACITYTNVAKDEIRERTDNHPVILTDTIHSFAWSLLKGFQPALRELIPTLSTKWETRIEEAGGLAGQKVIYDLGYPADRWARTSESEFLEKARIRFFALFCGWRGKGAIEFPM